MKQHLNATKLVVALLMIVIVIGFSAFRQKEGGKGDTFRKEHNSGKQDTSTRGKYNRTEDLKNQEKLEEAMKKLEEQMKKLDIELEKLDFSQMEKELEGAFKHLDEEKMNLQIEEAIKKATETAFKQIEFDKLNKEVQESLATFREQEMPKIRQEVERARQERAKSRAHMKVDREKIRADVEASMKGAKESMAKAREQAGFVENFTDALQADGLIDKKKSYKVEVKGGELYINGIKQTREVSDKYKQYYKKENFSIVIEKDDRI